MVKAARVEESTYTREERRCPKESVGVHVNTPKGFCHVSGVDHANVNEGWPEESDRILPGVNLCCPHDVLQSSSRPKPPNEKAEEGTSLHLRVLGPLSPML